MSSQPLASKLGTLYAGDQTALGTITTGLDAIRVVGKPQFTLLGEGTIERANLSSAYGGAVKPVHGNKAWDITFQTEFIPPTVIGADGANSTWQQRSLYEAVPLSIAYATGDTIILTPVSGFVAMSDFIPATIEWHQVDGLKIRVRDCVGTFDYSGDPGGRIMVNWHFMGIWEETPTDATLVTPTFGGDASPTIFKGGTLTDPSSGTAVQVGAFSFAPGLALQENRDGTESDGFAVATCYYQDAYATFGWTEPEHVVATRDPYVNWETVTNGALEFKNNSTGTELEIDFPESSQGNPVRSEANGYASYDHSILSYPSSSGNDQFSITIKV